MSVCRGKFIAPFCNLRQAIRAKRKLLQRNSCKLITHALNAMFDAGNHFIHLELDRLHLCVAQVRFPKVRHCLLDSVCDRLEESENISC